MKLKKIFFSFLLVCVTGNIYAQESINTSGGNTIGTGSSSYSIGPILTTTLTDGNYSITSGVQQTFEISIVLSTLNFKKSTLKLMAYQIQ